jgi:hypothetical protein
LKIFQISLTPSDPRLRTVKENIEIIRKKLWMFVLVVYPKIKILK